MTTWYVMMVIMLGVFLLDYLENDRKLAVNELTVFLVLIMAVLSGVRGHMGADLSGYKYFFEIIPPLDGVLFAGADYNPDAGLEPLYAIMVSTFKVFSENFNLFLFVQSLVLLLIVVKSLRRLQVPVNIGLILYFFLFYLSHFGQQRMAIVYVLCLLASTYVVTSNPGKFVAVVLAATLIQYTAIFFLPAYALRYVLLSTRRTAAPAPGAAGGSAAVAPRAKGARGRTFTLDGTTVVKIAIGFAIVWFITLRLDIFATLYGWLSAMSGAAGNVYAYKFISYYERIDSNLNIFNAWFGISANVAILAFLYVYRARWLNTGIAPVFAMFAFGLLIIIGVYSFPWLGDRLFRMYSIAALVGLFALVIVQQKGASVTLPFVLAICVYEYLSHIATETEVYKFMSF